MLVFHLRVHLGWPWEWTLTQHFGWEEGSGGSQMKLLNKTFNEVVFALEMTGIVLPQHLRNQENNI